MLFSRLEKWPTPTVALIGQILELSKLAAHFQSLSLLKATELVTATDLALFAIPHQSSLDSFHLLKS